MANFDIDAFDSGAIIVHFLCNNCQTPISSDEMVIPSPDYMGENTSDTEVQECETLTCDGCGKEFEITLTVNIGGGTGTIENLPENYSIEIDEV